VNPNLKDNLFKVWTGAHKALFKASSGRVLGRAAGMKVVLLITTGRKSGQPRETMLTTPVVDGDQVVLVASYGGDDRNPAWYLNLTAKPEVEIVMDGRRQAMTARVATAEEKAELWPRVVAAYKGYGGYQKRTSRDIPLVLLTPA
jgi:deazaflavin-dependent oxidoreductase (nitroreductase family)